MQDLFQVLIQILLDHGELGKLIGIQLNLFLYPGYILVATFKLDFGSLVWLGLKSLFLKQEGHSGHHGLIDPNNGLPHVVQV